MPRKKKPSEEHYAPPCAVEGCFEEAPFKAPKSRGGDSREYVYLCKEHIQQFNKSYDYFADMDEDAINAFQKDAVLGHRPTWKMGQGPSFSDLNLENGFRRFFGAIPVDNMPDPVPPHIKKALVTFELQHPVDETQIKTQYKKLVKRYHPDINKSHKAETIFKQITEKYRVLIEHYRI